jgi:tripartite-type tricarboxylate transporter receptor subunit TctC
MKFLRRQFLHLATGIAAVMAMPSAIWSQTYPSRPVTVIVPFAAGGPTETIRARLTELGGSVPDKAQRGPRPLATRVKTEIDRWAPIIKAASIKTE